MGYKIKDELAAKPEKILKLIVKKQEFEKEWYDESDKEEPAA